MEKPRTRKVARELQIQTIKATARRLLDQRGASELSLREVAREMNQTSSALYRYFANRDELLTALILDAYNDLGASTEDAEAVVARSNRRERWLVATRTIRRWALQHPHEYALVYGSPIPGYHAPVETIVAATRVTNVLGRIINDHFQEHPTAFDPSSEKRVAEFFELENLRFFMPNVPAEMLVKGIGAWTQVFGFVSFELFGHYENSVRDFEAYFDDVVTRLGHDVGIF
jgi:AcrR family transcriptional regulator